MKISFTLGLVIGAAFIFSYKQNNINIAIFFQLVSSVLLYRYGLPPKRYNLSPRLIIGHLTETQTKVNQDTEFWSFVGICLFILGQIIFIT